MSAVTSESVIISCFRTYYAALVRLREEVDADPWGASAHAVPSDVQAARESRVLRIQEELRTLLQEQEAEVTRLGGERASRRFGEAEYVMAALADEIFLSRDWEGRQGWAQDLLETRLFGTHVAGERLFENAEALLKARDDREMAMVHLLAFSLGFQGRYRGRGDTRVLEDLRERLLAFIARGGRVSSGEEAQLFPQAYAHTLEGDAHTRLPSTARWSMLFALTLVAYLVVAHLLWRDASAPLQGLTEEIGVMTTSVGGAR